MTVVTSTQTVSRRETDLIQRGSLGLERVVLL